MRNVLDQLITPSKRLDPVVKSIIGLVSRVIRVIDDWIPGRSWSMTEKRIVRGVMGCSLGQGI